MHIPQKEIKTDKKFLLVQYTTASNNLVHALLTENDVIKPETLHQHTRETLIKDGIHQHQATVLVMHENEKFMEHKFKKLKNMDMEGIFTGKYNSETFGQDEYVLLQYNCTPYRVVYTIRNQRETFCPGNNFYTNLTYFRESNNAFQAFVLEKSSNIEYLKIKMKMVEAVSMNLFISIGTYTKVGCLSPAKKTPTKFRRFSFFERIMRNKGI